MKNKILVELIVPALDQKFNVYLPINRKIGNVINLLNRALYEITNGIFVGDDRTYLYDRATGDLLPINSLVREVGIKNGSSVILM